MITLPYSLYLAHLAAEIKGATITAQIKRLPLPTVQQCATRVQQVANSHGYQYQTTPP